MSRIKLNLAPTLGEVIAGIFMFLCVPGLTLIGMMFLTTKETLTFEAALFGGIFIVMAVAMALVAAFVSMVKRDEFRETEFITFGELFPMSWRL